MAKSCDVCGKGPQFGNNVSHANNKTRRKWSPNVHRVRVLEKKGHVTRKLVCTQCLRSNRVTKATRVRSWTRTAAAQG